MSKAEKTKLFILEQTAEIFNKKGYAATSLSDITQATGLTKGSIYGNFQNKEEVAIAAFEYNATNLYKKLRDVSTQEGQTNKDRLLALVDLYRNHWDIFYQKGGCPLLNAATDADDTFPELKKSVAYAFEQWAKLFAEIITNGIEQHEFKKESDAYQYAYLFISLIEGGIVLSKTTNKINHLYNTLDRIVLIINNEITL
ncbi:MAG: TetR/AcrR family transcriptional regulator [Flavobacteriaceae bacterium]|jgi:AcrR family transcriptional regulator|nr:TetR/AcrR family transcriptional regulator [Flavobacteriaceae bacterium]